MRKLWWLLTSRRPTAEQIDEFNLPQPKDMQAFCEGMGDPYADGLIERDLAIRERLEALWREERGPIIASIIWLGVMVCVLLLTYGLVRP